MEAVWRTANRPQKAQSPLFKPTLTNVQQAVRQFFNNAHDRDLIERNHFARFGASKRKRRIDRPDFEIITDEQYERLRRCARESRADNYGLIIEGAILAVGEAAMRPGELFALHRTDLDFAENIIHIRRQLDMDTRVVTPGPRTTTGAGS
jgi:integrase